VGYIPVFIEDKATSRNIRLDLGKDASYVIQRMDRIPYLVKADIGTKNIVLYALSDFKHHLYSTTEPESIKRDVPYTNIEHAMINPSEYRLTVQGFSKPIYLNFTELYDSNWKMHLGDFKWWGPIFNKDYFITDSIHSKNYLGFNQFYLDPKMICSSQPCNFEATIYYKPQSYLYIGLILSGTTLVLVVGSAIYLWRKNEK
jgi:hypothetical protein